jgi:hypothetical protein
MKKKFLSLLLFVFLLITPQVSSIYNWSEPIKLNSESFRDSYRACVGLDSTNTFHITWKDNSDIIKADADWDIFYKNKQGLNWSNTTIVTPFSFNDSTCLSMTIDKKDMIHIAWKDDSDILHSGSDWDIFYTYKTNASSTWSQPVLISKNSTGVCSCPSISTDNDGSVHISYADTTYAYDNDSDSDIIYTFKTKNKPWTQPQLVTGNSTKNAIDTCITTDNSGNVHLVWYEMDEANDSSEIMYTLKQTNSTWHKPTRISSSEQGYSVDPWITVDTKNTIHLIWNDNTNLFDNGRDYDIFYRIKNFDQSWSNITLISKDSTSNCKWPTMYIGNSNTVFVAWSDKTGYTDTNNDYDIVYTYTNQTHNWPKVQVVTQKSIYNSNWPRFTVDTNGSIHMTWWDRFPDQWVTYYCMGTPVPNEILPEKNTPLQITSVLILSIIILSILFKKYKK